MLRTIHKTIAPSQLFSAEKRARRRSAKTAKKLARQCVRTDRLKLRPLKKSDAAQIAALAGDWEIASMVGRIPHPYNEEMAQQWIERTEDDFAWGITYKGALIGVAGFMEGEENEREIGYWLGVKWWGRGFATEAACAIITLAFNDPAIDRLKAAHFYDNSKSKRVITKLNFKLLGDEERYCAARNCMMHSKLYMLERQAWNVRPGT